MTTKKAEGKTFESRIEKAEVYTTSAGGRYVKPFDIIRSEKGRTQINSSATVPQENSIACGPRIKISKS